MSENEPSGPLTTRASFGLGVTSQKHLRQWLEQSSEVTEKSTLESSGLAGRLFQASFKLLTSLLETAKQSDKVNQVDEKNYRNELERLFLWGDGFGARDGSLDELLDKSSELKVNVLSLLSELAKIAIENLFKTLKPSNQKVFEEIADVRMLLDATETVLNEGGHPIRNTYEFSDSESAFSSDGELAEGIDDIASYTDCLMDLAPALEHPALDVEIREEYPIRMVETFNVSSTIAANYCRKIRDRFPILDLKLVERLGEANEKRSQRIQAELAKTAKAPQDLDAEDQSEKLFSRSGGKHTETTKSTYVSESIFSTERSRNVGISKEDFEDYNDATSETTFGTFSVAFSTAGQGISRVPSLPESARSGVPFNCLACGKLLRNIRNRRVWKKHIFNDLHPYICTATGNQDDTCSQMFGSRSAWIRHETAHLAPITEYIKCSFCPSTKAARPTSSYFKHLSRHLREIALAILPQSHGSESDSEVGSASSKQALSDISSLHGSELESRSVSDGPKSITSYIRNTSRDEWGEIPPYKPHIPQSPDDRIPRNAHLEKQPTLKDENQWLEQDEQRRQDLSNIQIDPDPPNSNALVPPDNEGAQWPLDCVLLWLSSNQFSNDWQETFKALNIYGSVFLELNVRNDVKVDYSMMRSKVYPRLAKECSTSGTGWDQTRERAEGERLCRLIHDIVTGRNTAATDPNPSTVAQNEHPSTTRPPEQEAEPQTSATPKIQACRYKTGKILARGSTSSIKECVSIETGKYYAAKVIHKKGIAGKEEKMRTEILIRKTIGFNHPNLLTLVDYFETLTNLYLVLELALGGDLLDRICRKGSYYESDAADIVRGVVSGVAWLHDHDIVHRNIKAENILFRTPEDNADVLISGFGLSKHLDAEVGRDVLTTPSGTPGYMAPEILNETGHGKPVDMWAIGVLTYFLLCGYPPFDRDSNLEEMQAVLVADFSFTPIEYWRGVSLHARDFIKRCLVIDPNHRITASEALKHSFVTKAPGYFEFLPSQRPEDDEEVSNLPLPSPTLPFPPQSILGLPNEEADDRTLPPDPPHSRRSTSSQLTPPSFTQADVSKDRININLQIPLDEKLCIKLLTSYHLYTITKLPSIDVTARPTWARAEVVEQKLSQQEISDHIERLNSQHPQRIPITPAEKKAVLAPFQQGQITRLLDDLAMTETDESFKWSLAQLDKTERKIPSSGQLETVTISVYVKRAPRDGLNPIHLYQQRMEKLEMERNNAHGDHPNSQSSTYPSTDRST